MKLKAELVLLLVIAVASCNADDRDSKCRHGNLSESAPGAVQDVARFLTQLKAAVATNDKRAMAELIEYPLLVSTPTGKFRVRSRKQLEKDYKRVFTDDLKVLIMSQQPECVSRIGAQGFTIGNGELWFDKYPDGKYRVFTITPVLQKN